MFISRFRVESFSSFADSGWIDLDAHFNLFIGTNNSGKSALLRSLYNPLPNNPHKSAQAFRGSDLIPSVASFDVEITVEELLQRFRALGIRPTFPCGGDREENISAMGRLLSKPDHRFTLQFERKANADPTPRAGASIVGMESSSQAIMQFRLKNEQYVADGRRGEAEDNLNSIVSGQNSATLFYFDAQRLNVGLSNLESPERLLPSARNLPAVLAHLQGSRKPIFDIIESHVTSILGGIGRITVTPRPDNKFEIMIWPDRDSAYEELAFSLNDSGTGVGQLLAIITAAVTTEQSILLIDEINSFLHPTAVKKLLSLLRSEYPQHQYVISTHSADAINSASAEKIYLVHREGFESSVKAIDVKDAQQAREVSSTLGFSMMDVFGYERMIWVEGPTEEVAFPFIARHTNLASDSSIGFASVASTSAFEKKRGESRSAADIYEQAGKRLSPLLRGMAFALDRERLSDDEVAKAERSHRKLRYLPRRCFECYLINAAAIHSVLSELDTNPPELAAVEQALLQGGAQAYGAENKWTGDVQNPEWLKVVDGARLLSDIFATVTEHRVEYRKTRDGISLLKWLLEKEPASLDGLSDFIGKILEIALRDTAP